MAGSAAHSRTLFIEGTDDEHAMGQLLVRRGFDPQVFPAFEDSGGKEGVLRAIRVAIRAATARRGQACTTGVALKCGVAHS